ncbi:DNA polymerase I [Hugenholtzia roseola]|uniref:DNA polymerase I n=1 Tax=Hugenholtzia roseola TaxID=1002 RepID=UPI0004138835|nr:DNA polymerase I [Hugenholtzia roseola]
MLSTLREKKVFLVDAMAVIYRAHFAFSKNPRLTSKGLDTGAIMGFTNTILEILQKEKPTHFGVAFDTAAPTFRHQAFEEYKAHRQKQPEGITAAKPYIRRILEALKIPILALDGYEADDLIGTLAKKAEKEGYQTYMVTIDKDYAQLVSDNIFFYKLPFAGKSSTEIWGIKEVCERWEIERPEQVIDILGLQGDASDNIPGIPNIGEKTAIKLVKEFGSVENLIANVAQLKGKQQENVRDFAQQGLLSKALATIDVEVPIAFEPEKLIVEPFDRQALSQIFDELEFRTLKKRLLGEDSSESKNLPTQKSDSKAAANLGGLFANPAAQTLDFAQTLHQVEDAQQENAAPKRDIRTRPHDYFLVQTDTEIDALVDFLGSQKVFAFDTETTSLDVLEAEIVGISFSYRQAEAFYVPLLENREATLNKFKSVLEDPAIEKIGQNIKYDYQILNKYGIEVKGAFFDTMVAHYLIEPDLRHNMDYLSETLLHYRPISIETLIGKKGKGQGNMGDLSPTKIFEYAAEDADITFCLYQKLKEPLANYQKLFDQMEMPLVKVLAKMELEGVRIDTEALQEYSKNLEQELVLLEENIFKQAGTSFLINSPKQLGEILFEKLKLDEKAKRTAKTKQYQTDEKVLQKLTEKHPIIPYILEYRELQKLKSTYVDALPALISPHTGRVHTSFNQAVAATGRLSSTQPNLQNIPIKTERGREVRKAFIPRDEQHCLLSVDYSQIELRIMAVFSQDQTMIESFAAGRDIHAATAAKIFQVPLEQVTADMRRQAKTANFGIIYGISAFGLSERLGIASKKANELIEAYFREFPSIKKYMDEIIAQARQTEYVETLFGRRRYLRDINSRNYTMRGMAERNAINAPIQGSAADIIKLAMIKIDSFLEEKKYKTKLILQVHDELVFDVPLQELDEVRPQIIALMEKVVEWAVPLQAQAGVGKNWLEAH